MPSCTSRETTALGVLRAIHVGGSSRVLTDLANAVAAGPGMVVGDFDGDGADEVRYLRVRASFLYPLATLGTMDGSGGVRNIPVHTWYLSSNRPSYAATLGTRASGRLRLLNTDRSWEEPWRGLKDIPEE